MKDQMALDIGAEVRKIIDTEWQKSKARNELIKQTCRAKPKEIQNCFSREKVSPVRLSFGDALWFARKQINVRDFMPLDVTMAETCARVMADVYMLSTDQKLQIDGETMTAAQVTEIYSQLTMRHVESVISKYRMVSEEIKSVRRYLRTMLYNAVFELDAEDENVEAIVRADMGGAT